MSPKYFLSIIIGLFVIGFLALYFSIASPSNPAISSINKSSKVTLDGFLTQNNADQKVSEAYKFAEANPSGVLDQIPCYCGCMETDDHKSNRDCFIENSGAGYGEMGLNCGTCVGTALLTKEMQSKNASVNNIKQAVDAKFKPKTS